MIEPRVLAVSLLSLLLAEAAWANGTVVGSTSTFPLGRIVPLETAQVRLVSETLSIKLLASTSCRECYPVETIYGTEGCPRGRCPSNLYQVKARYMLSNPGPALRVLYGVPIYDAPVASGIPDNILRAPDPQRTVRVRIGGKTHSCQRKKVNIPRRLALAYVKAAEEGGYDSSPLGEEGSFQWDDWCVTRLIIPSGDPVALELEYTSALLYDVFSGSPCQPNLSHPRRLLYPLAPAGTWGGNAEDLDIEVDLGPFAALAQVLSPAGGQRSGSKVRWSFRGVDLKKMPGVSVEVDYGPLDDYPREAGSLSGEREGLVAVRAAKAESGHPVQQLVDGHVARGWCAAGSDRWFELELLGHPLSSIPAYTEGLDQIIYPVEMRDYLARLEKRKKVSADPTSQERLAQKLLAQYPLIHDLRTVVREDPTRILLVVGHVRSKGSAAVKTLRVALCDDPSTSAELTVPQVPAPAGFMLSLAGKLEAGLKAALERWGKQLKQWAGSCLARCAPACRAKHGGERDYWSRLNCQYACERACFKAATQQAARSNARGPCLRFTLPDAAPGQGPSCIDEIVAPVGRFCAE